MFRIVKDVDPWTYRIYFARTNLVCVLHQDFLEDLFSPSEKALILELAPNQSLEISIKMQVG